MGCVLFDIFWERKSQWCNVDEFDWYIVEWIVILVEHTHIDDDSDDEIETHTYGGHRVISGEKKKGF